MTPKPSVILAFESSCDETAIAAVSESGSVHFERLWSQVEVHQKFGGVVPEVASRSHFEAVQILSLDLENFTKQFQIESVVSTMGPGLIGPLLVASNMARGLAFGLKVPFRGIHHLRGHVASALIPAISREPAIPLRQRAQSIFPAVVFLVSGGHTQVLLVDRGLHSKVLAETADDAAGECLDKCAKLMGLPYPGGPAIEALALGLEAHEVEFARELSQRLPRPKALSGFSFSGLKTAFRLLLESEANLKGSAALAWAIQDAVFDSLLRGLKAAIKGLSSETLPSQLVFCGGVAANQVLRTRLERFSVESGLQLHLPPQRYATDNAVMIATAAWVQDPVLDLFQCQARVPLAGPL